MASIDIHIGNQKFAVRGDSDDLHLTEVAQTVQDKVEELLKAHPNQSSTKIALLAAMEFASATLKSKDQMREYRANLLEKAGEILNRIEKELTPASN